MNKLRRDLTNCPSGHTPYIDDDNIPHCEQCELIATHYNERTLEVYDWETEEIHRQNVIRMNDALDFGFDNTWFNDDRW